MARYVLLAAVMFGLVLLCAGLEIKRLDYLPKLVPIKNHGECKFTAFRDIVDNLSSYELSNPDSFVEGLRRHIIEMVREPPTYNVRLAEIWHTKHVMITNLFALADQLYEHLADDERNKRSGLMVGEFLVAHQIASELNLQGVLEYLEANGPYWFQQLAEVARRQLENTLERGLIEREGIDKFFRRAVGLEDHDSDATLYARLKEIRDVTKERWDVEKLSEIIDRPNNQTPSGLFSHICSKFRTPFMAEQFDSQTYFDARLKTINLAAALNGGEDPFENNDRLQVVNEMWRICMRREENITEFNRNLYDQFVAGSSQTDSSG